MPDEPVRRERFDDVCGRTAGVHTDALWALATVARRPPYTGQCWLSRPTPPVRQPGFGVKLAIDRAAVVDDLSRRVTRIVGALLSTQPRNATPAR